MDLIFGKDEKQLVISLEDYINHSNSLYSKELALQIGVNMIANLISKCDFDIYEKGKKVKDSNFYVLNKRPNNNDYGTNFWKRVVKRLILESECLIVHLDEKLYIAESFQKSDAALYGKTYSQIMLEEGFLLNRSFQSSEVVHLKLENKELLNYLDNLYTEYSKLLKASKSGYISKNVNKYKMVIDGVMPKMISEDTSKEITFNEYKNKFLDKLLSEETEIIPTARSLDIELLNGVSTSKQSEDFVILLNKSFEIVAMTLNIPIDLFMGKTTEKSQSINDLITFACEPIMKVIEDGLDVTFFTQKQYLDGCFVKINKQQIEHLNILNKASNMDKLFSIGYSHDDINELIGLPLKNEEWAKKHHVTKNYSDVENIEVIEGGE